MISKNKQIIKILAIAIIACTIMAITDLIIQPSYIIKSFIKIICFLILPLSYFTKNNGCYIKSLFILKQKGIIRALLLGILIYCIIICAYLIVRNFYDFSSITDLLISNVGVNNHNFILVAVYISFCNSLLEEFFFRGFCFLFLKKFLDRKLAYLFSAILFGAYHISIMYGWFSPILFVIAVIGLIIGGCLFNYLDEKNETIYNSWMVHMSANFAINTVGLILFSLI